MRSIPITLLSALTLFPLVTHAADKAEPNPSSTAEVVGADTEHARQIRRSLVEDKTLSIAAQNVHIEVKDGVAHLSGVVKSELERKEIEVRANSVMGDGKVMSHLKVDTQ